jgi:peptide deformylase
MFNPIILEQTGEYETIEGCLSLTGCRKTKRYKKIKVSYEDMNFKKKIKYYNGFKAQIIEHEIDHLNGVVI